ncbi:enoyl-CoA hydratase/isomerase family protein [Umezawaea sp.]|uniref:enoyl-CoA hydratase/isomerase family protein n=1 Tax=Umezawaea sp. TaxID=1955258 RepID=UPI002ED699F3
MSVTLEFTDGVALILVEHSSAGPTGADLAAVRSALDAASDAVAVVLHGGDRSFFSGVDLRMVARTAPAEVRAHAEGLRALCAQVARMAVPVVAAIGGDAVGGGCALAMACDARVLVDGGSLGSVTSAQADRAVLIGRRVPAAEALRAGLVDLVVPPCALLASARELAVSHAAHAPRKRAQEYAKVR